ncbi:MAG: beta-ketoacyl synthase N-terminal-like domain-containing protein, partial [Gammaproteobacteria bacterium]
MRFEPIAVVGEGCVLPGALSPAALWQAVRAGEDLIGSVPAGHWCVDAARVLDNGTPESVLSDRGGYVSGFDGVFDPDGLAVEAQTLRALDPLCQWLVHCARQALAPLAHAALPVASSVILGNLSYPSRSLVALTEAVLLDTDAPAPDALNRFMSGYPAHLLTRAFGLSGSSYCLDAACASSLYAIKLACDALHERRADLVLAGGVNAADDLFLHTGFSVLQALSPSGRSRPFHRDADGLVPAQGAALVALKRLGDAEAAGDEVLAIIRAVGLSNDGRSKGFLAPDEDGQVRAMRAAYDLCGLAPHDTSLIECHATGTALGDAVELASMARVFGDCEGLPIGSLKSNLGHLITASGAAALIKVSAAMRAGIRPATLHADIPLESLESAPFRLLHEAEPWPSNGAPRRAAVNNFGFGGNNAHLILEQWVAPVSGERLVSAPPRHDESVAIVAIGAAVGDGRSRDAFSHDLFSDAYHGRRDALDIEVTLTGLAMPPSDVTQALPQQLALLGVVRDALDQCATLPAERTAALVGMQCAAETARYGLRWALAERVSGQSEDASSAAQLRDLQELLRPTLVPAGVVGCMPNIVANRLNVLFDWRGPSFTVSSEELSGTVALNLGLLALRRGELDAVVVGAVDLSCEPVHAACARAVLPDAHNPPGDAAVALVLKRLADAVRDGDTVYGMLDGVGEDSAALPCDAENGDTAPGVSGNDRESTRLDSPDADRAIHAFVDEPHEAAFLARSADAVTPRFGHAHAAAGLLAVSAAALACASRARLPAGRRRAVPWTSPQEHRIRVETAAFSGQRVRIEVSDSGGSPALPVPRTDARLFVFTARDRRTLREKLAQCARADAVDVEHVESPGGAHEQARLAIVCPPGALGARLTAAIERIDARVTPAADAALAPDVYFREQPLAGDLAYAFTGAVAAYADMGRDLVLALPEVAAHVTHRFSCLG